MKIKRRLIAAAAAAVLLCGCEKNAATDEKKQYSVPDYTLAGELHDGGENIFLIVKSVNNSYFKVMFEAARDASAELGCNVWYSGAEDSSDWQAQSKLMDIAVQNGADAVILAPNDSVNLADKAQELYDKGIAVICVDAVINRNTYNVCYMTDNLAAGEQAAEQMLMHLKNSGIPENGSARVVVQTGRSMSQTISERVAGFCQYWAENAPGGWEIVKDFKSNEGDDSKAFSLAEEFFKEYDDINGVFGTNVGTTRGFAEYISESGRTDVAIVGFDYSDEIAALVRDGSYRASMILQRQYDMAYNGIKAAAEIKNGTFSMDRKVFDTGILAVNSTNINDPDVKSVIERN